MKKIIAVFPLLLVFVLLSHACFAPPLPPVPSDGAPLDGFSILLIVLGVAYGGYYLRKKRKETAAKTQSS